MLDRQRTALSWSLWSSAMTSDILQTEENNRSVFIHKSIFSHNQWSVCVPKTSVLILRLPSSDSQENMKMICSLSNERRLRIAGGICATADPQFTLKICATREKRSKRFSWSKSTTRNGGREWTSERKTSFHLLRITIKWEKCEPRSLKILIGVGFSQIPRF